MKNKIILIKIINVPIKKSVTFHIVTCAYSSKNKVNEIKYRPAVIKTTEYLSPKVFT